MVSDRESVITHLRIINTWATVDLRSPKEPIWSFRTLEDVKQWTNDALAMLKEQDERIKMLEHQLETITRWRANAGAFD